MAPLPVLLALLGVVLPTVAGDSKVSVFPKEATVLRGGFIRLNCSFSGCDQHRSSLKLGLETHFPKEEVDNGTNWKLFKLQVPEDSTPLCFLSCPDEEQRTDTVSLTVYNFPDRVELSPLPPWQPVGENLTLRCHVEGGAPRHLLTAVLLRGQEELSRQPVVGEPAEVTATVRVGKDNHGANFSCRTELDLRSKGLELFLNTSASSQLRAFVLPETAPGFVTPGSLEAGTRWLVTCSLDGLFPALEAQVHLALGDHKLNTTVTYRDDSLSASASLEVTTQEEGDQQLVCAVLLGNQSRESRRNLTVYSFPEPVLTLNPSEALEGDVVTVSCEARPGAIVTLSSAPAQSLSWESRLILNASAENNNRSFFCSAALEVAGQVLYKNKTQQLTVLYGPRLNDSDCPGSWTWPEGTQQILRCQARGNPCPQLHCYRKSDNISLPIGSLRSVNREHEGTYVCRAVNALGEASREVLVTVTYNQNNTVFIIIVLVAIFVVVGAVVLAIYFYNRQRKIRKYEMQKAAEALLLKPKPLLPESAPDLGPRPLPHQEQQQQQQQQQQC